MAAFFSQIGYKPTGEWKEEIVFFDPAARRKPAGAGAARRQRRSFPTAPPRRSLAGQGPARGLRRLADRRRRTPGSRGNIVNRVWYWLLGRGIIHEPDDIRPDNPPQNPELLAYLAQELVAAHYDLKHLYRLILNSKTYQLSSHSQDASDPEAAANFAYYPLRRLEAEVLIDALCQITGTTESYSSIIPEPFTFIPEDQRSIALPDGSITSSFLEMFGRPPRDTGLESERNNRPTAAQRLHLLNSSHIRARSRRAPRLQALLDGPGRAASEPQTPLPDDPLALSHRGRSEHRGGVLPVATGRRDHRLGADQQRGVSLSALMEPWCGVLRTSSCGCTGERS